METSYIKAMFKTNSDLVAKATADIPAEQWMRKPDDSSNHLMWIIGHLICVRGNLLRSLGVDWRLAWAKQFARGSKETDIKEYPALEEIRRAWTDVSHQVATCLASVPAEVLEKPHENPTFDGTTGGFVAFLAFHDTYHVGQVAYLRKWLGHGQLVG